MDKESEPGTNRYPHRRRPAGAAMERGAAGQEDDAREAQVRQTPGDLGDRMRWSRGRR